ncbi:MAG TPA: rhodanese-like domain-containing protein [Vicinamibacterales bacterium]|nr:rhodanese-like domain-containing protein [Vicinamibacterales bacterium]
MLITLTLAASVAAGAAAAGPIVSADWLQAHLSDPQVRVICVDDDGYARGHIPGARPISHMDTISGDHVLLPADALGRVFAKAGVTDGARIVLYGDPMSAGFIYGVLSRIGLADNVSWLDGGMTAWRAGHRPVETKTPAPGEGPLTVATPAADSIVDAAWVRAHLNSPTTKILDVRTTQEWERGHLPGATLILWQDLFADAQHQTFKSPEQIRALLAKAGVAPAQEVVTYCAVGMRASLMAFAARAAGVTTHLYLGSWQDWSKDPSNPIVR